jgi:hypothetical protein
MGDAGGETRKRRCADGPAFPVSSSPVVPSGVPLYFRSPRLRVALLTLAGGVTYGGVTASRSALGSSTTRHTLSQNPRDRSPNPGRVMRGWVIVVEHEV